MAELLRNLPELRGLQPARDQNELPRLLQKVGQGVDDFFRNFPNTASVEEVHQERLQRNGKIRTSVDQTFEYLCLVKTLREGIDFDEHRMLLRGPHAGGSELEQGLMLTSGFTSASLPFHSLYQGQAAFRYLGTQIMNGHNLFVIAYAQRPEARLSGAFRAGQLWAKTLSQGLAWIDPATYQIVRMRSDLLTPLPEVRLERETTDIQFDEVHFKQIAAGLWLPREVAVTVEWAGKILRNRHSYSEFKVFNVEANEKFKKANPRE